MKTHTILHLALSAASLGTLAAATTAQDSLLFSTHNGAGFERTSSGSSGTQLGRLTRHDLAVVTPGGAPSAETWLPHAGLDAMLGDRNCDASFVAPDAGWAIDAATFCGQPTNPGLRELFVSFYDPIGTPGATPVIGPADIVSPRPGGAHAVLISGAQLRSAFAIPAAESINVDAFCMLDDRTVLVSFEDDHTVLGGLTLHDGGVGMIPYDKLFYSNCQVIDSVPSSGVILFDEPTTDMYVGHSAVADAAGAAVVTIEDLNALTVDCDSDGEGLWAQVEGQAQPYWVPDLIFNGSTLTGAAVVSTALGGSIATLNGVPLASAAPAPTTGAQLGLAPGSTPIVRTLSAMAVMKGVGQPLRVVLDASDQTPAAGAVFTVSWGGADAFGPIGVFAKLGLPGACTAQTSVPLPNPGYGYWFNSAAPPFLIPVVGDALGFGTLTLAAPSPALGLPVILQPVANKAGIGPVVVGSPVIIEL